jgi:deoxynucleoside triphosphate triphosphohydrolase SAMHD1
MKTRNISLLDRVHEHVQLPPLVVRAMDTAQFQRLRGLKQLGASSYLYPGAVHTRFEHSIGVAHMARSFLTIIQEKQPELGITRNNIEHAMLAGLYHDVGHGPFSHLFEDAIAQHCGGKFCHEQMSQTLARQALAPILGADDLKEVLSLMSGSNRDLYPHASVISNKRNGIDVDRLDYFLRDSLCCFGKPTVDVRSQRLFQTARILRDPKSNEWVVAFEEKMAIAIRELFSLRAKLHKQVYQHHVTKAVGHMIADAFRLAVPHFRIGGLSLAECVAVPEHFLKLGDWILEAIEHDPNPQLLAAQQVIQRIRTRELYKLICACTLKTGVKLSSVEIAAAISQRMPQSALDEPQDFIADVAVINHGTNDKDPLQFVTFFNPKRDNPAPSFVAPNSSPLFCPMSFEERTVMIFQRRASIESRAAVADWISWATSSGLIEPQLPFFNAS